MNRVRLSRAGINFREGLGRMNGDRASYEGLLASFALDDTHEAMLAALDAGDVDESFRLAHSIKGISGNLSLTALYDAIFPFVEELRAGRIDGARAILAPVEQAYSTTVDAIKAEMDN